LRGSGRFISHPYLLDVECTRLNPLHCGAVVASERLPPPKGGAIRVSIPFIAGQWSLPAVVVGAICWRARVSIPFIAGQWSLRAAPRRRRRRRRSSQSPSLRGSGRFSLARPLARRRMLGSQSPSLRGSGRFTSALPHLLLRLPVSIPFIAGQWSLLFAEEGRDEAFDASQSPSLRGSGRFREGVSPLPGNALCLNPLHCGAVVASVRRAGAPRAPAQRSQSPSLRGSGRFTNLPFGN